MGLDMYLSKKTYIGNQYKEENEQLKIILPKVESIFSDDWHKIKQNRISSVTEQVAYWRKFNALHNWMVENIQNGNDDCEEYYVDKMTLEWLLDEIKQDINTIKRQGYDKDNLNLVPKGGFFFGNTEIDEYHLENLKETRDILQELLQDSVEGYYYSSSW